MKQILKILVSILINQITVAQIDTSIILSQIAKNDTIIENSSSADTMLVYGLKSLHNLEEISSDLPSKIYLRRKAKILSQIASAYYYIGDYNKAIEYTSTELQINHRIKNGLGIASCYNTLGLMYSEKGDKTLALEYYFKALEIDNKYKIPEKIATRYNNIGNIYLDIADYNKAIDYFNKTIKIYFEINDTINIFYSYNNLASTLRRQGKYSQAIQNFNFALQIIKNSNDYNSIATCLSNIGVVYQNWNMPDKSLKYFKEALEYNKKSNNLVAIGIRYNNIASAFKDLEIPDSAIYYFNKSKEIFSKYGLMNYVATVNSNIGNVYTAINNYSKAIEIYFKSLQIQKENNISADLVRTYSKIGNTYKLMKNFDQAIFYLTKAKNLADSLGLISDLSLAYNSLAEVYKEKGNPNIAYDLLRKHIELKDSIFNKENQKQINEFDVSYQTLKKETKIKLLEKEKAIDKLEIKNNNTRLKTQRIIIYLTIIGIILFIIFIIILLKHIKAKKEANNLLKERNEEINQQKEEIISQRDEISKQNEILNKHLEIIEHQKTELTDSIYYAQNIQKAVLPEESKINNIFPESFIFYQPKDIVSGDFFWFNKLNINNIQYRVIASVDSTGHGVPGALMSMLGVSFISDIFNQNKECNKPEQVLNLLRKKVVDALKQKGDFNETKDGFDMAICIINDNENKLYFAGANTGLKIIRDINSAKIKTNKIIKQENKILYEIKGNRMPISISRKIRTKFTGISINIKKNDTIYLMSDGFADQFGGTQNTKFKSKRLNKLLLSIQNYDMTVQKQKIIEIFNNWKGKNEQTDDILIIGIKCK